MGLDDQLGGNELPDAPGAGHLLTLEQPVRANALRPDWLAALRR